MGSLERVLQSCMGGSWTTPYLLGVRVSVFCRSEGTSHNPPKENATMSDLNIPIGAKIIMNITKAFVKERVCVADLPSLTLKLALFFRGRSIQYKAPLYHYRNVCHFMHIY
jgi:hypothetical protein